MGGNAAQAREAPPPRPAAHPVLQPITGNDALILATILPFHRPVGSNAALQSRGHGVNVGNIADGRQHDDDNDELPLIGLGPHRRRQATQRVPEPRLPSLRPHAARRPDA